MRRQVFVCVVATAVVVGAGAPKSGAVAEARVGPQGSQPAASSPEAQVRKFCQLDGEGRQLTEEGWRAIAPLFVTAGTRPDLDSRSSSETMVVIVNKPCTVAPATLSDKGRTATVDTSRRAVGTLDLALGKYTPTVPGGVAGRGPVRLIKTADSGWQIEGPVPPPQLTVQTAIRELEALRGRTADADVKRNATHSLALLRALLRKNP